MTFGKGGDNCLASSPARFTESKGAEGQEAGPLAAALSSATELLSRLVQRHTCRPLLSQETSGTLPAHIMSRNITQGTQVKHPSMPISWKG